MRTADATDVYLASLPSELSASPLAMAALALAEGLDDLHCSLTSRSMAAKAFQDILRELRDLAPAPETKDKVDELSARSRSLGRRRQRGAAA